MTTLQNLLHLNEEGQSELVLERQARQVLFWVGESELPDIPLGLPVIVTDHWSVTLNNVVYHSLRGLYQDYWHSPNFMMWLNSLVDGATIHELAVVREILFGEEPLSLFQLSEEAPTISDKPRRLLELRGRCPIIPAFLGYNTYQLLREQLSPTKHPRNRLTLAISERLPAKETYAILLQVALGLVAMKTAGVSCHPELYDIQVRVTTEERTYQYGDYRVTTRYVPFLDLELNRFEMNSESVWTTIYKLTRELALARHDRYLASFFVTDVDEETLTSLPTHYPTAEIPLELDVFIEHLNSVASLSLVSERAPLDSFNMVELGIELSQSHNQSSFAFEDHWEITTTDEEGRAACFLSLERVRKLCSKVAQGEYEQHDFERQLQLLMPYTLHGSAGTRHLMRYLAWLCGLLLDSPEESV